MKNKKNYMYIIVIFLVTVLLLWELFTNVRYRGFDTIFHVTNIIKLSETISLGNLFGSNIIIYEFNKFGYGVWLFYPKFPHLLTSYIYLIIKNVYLSMKIVYLLNTFFAGIFTFYLAKKICNNKLISLLSSIAYISVPFHICQIYLRDAFAESFMFMVLPMIFLGLYNLKENNYLKFYVFFILGYMIGMNSHLVSMFFYTMFVGIFILYYHKVFFDKKRFKALLISSLIVVGLTLPFLITILEHKFLGIYRVFTDSFANLYDLQVLCLNFSSLFKAISTFSGVMCYFNIGLICLFVLTTFSLFSRKNDVNNEVKIIFLLLIIILIILVCSKSIWKYVPKLFLSIQFPWRLLVLLSLLVSLYSPMILVDIKINKYIKNILVIILIVLCVFDGINNIKYYDNEEINVDEALVSDLSLGYQNEYSPYVKCGLGRIILSSKWCYPIKDYKIDSNNDSMIEIIDDKFPNMEFVVSDLTEDTIIEFPRTFYLGYELLSEDGDEFQLYNNEFGFLTSSINKNGVYKLNYVKTKFHRIAEFIRLLTCLLILIFLLVRVIKFLINNER